MSGKNKSILPLFLIKKIMKFIVPFKWLLVGSLILNSCFSLLSVASVSLIKPISEIIFEHKINTNSSENSLNVGFLATVKNHFFDTVSSLLAADQNNLQITLIRFGILIFVVFLLKNIVKYISGVVSCKLEEGVIKHIRDTFFTKLNTLSIDFFNKNTIGNLISIITNDVTVINSATINAFSVTMRDSLQIIIYIFVLFSISMRLTLITFVAGAAILIIVRIAVKYLRQYATRMQQAMADFTSTISEIISGARIVKAFNGEDDANQKFKNDTQFYVKSIVKHQKISSLVPILSELAAIVALCVVLLEGGSLILSDELTSSDLMFFLSTVFFLMSPIITVANCIAQFQRGFISAERIFGILDKTPTVIDGTQEISDFQHCIELKNVSFKYNENYVLNNINLKIEKGKQVAFVGSSGSGKSTLLDLLIRFYDPIEGNIYIDGINLKDLKTKSYRSLFGIVSQENILFNDTVRNNITFGYKNFSEKDLENAAKISNSYNFINEMPQKFDTFIGDRGVNISGGERQRIAIARALLRNPQILIFDEATSALDASSEKIVQNAINSSLANKTAFIVAHRLSTIINCDLIVVFDKGNIVEQGTHLELIEKQGYYKHLYDLQFKNSH